MSEGGEF